MTIDGMTRYEIAPCLADGPLSAAGNAFADAANALGRSRFASVIRAWCVANLFLSMESLLAGGDEPIAGMDRAMRRLTMFLDNANAAAFPAIELNGKHEMPVPSRDVKEVTGNHYGNLFKEFSPDSYWDEPVRLLRQRLTRNGIESSDFENKRVLDSGCGGGRYSAAWRLLGARPVTGVDISPINVSDAKRRAEVAQLDDIHFQEGNVLELPFETAEFDIVFSNGVLHHTTDWKKGVSELLRVLKPGGWGWLYLIENPGGIFWDVIEVLRVVMKDEDKALAREALQMIGVPANRVFYMLDHVMVPINLRLTPRAIEDCLRSCDAVNIRRLERGADIDRIERIYNNERWAAERFGAGENRYVFNKPV